MGRDKRASKAARDQGGFVALPWVVMDSAAYQGLSYPARALLLEMARQLRGDNNGALLCSRAYLATRGWRSNDTMTSAKRELLAAGFLFETVMGQRPNKASWYAVTWQALDRLPGFDAGAAALFVRSAYRNAGLIPPAGTERLSIVPPAGTEKALPVPPAGTIRAPKRTSPVPPAGHHLEVPSMSAVVGGPNA